MDQEQQQVLGMFFIFYPLMLIFISKTIGKARFSHPFILFNVCLMTIGAGLSITSSLFLIGILTTIIFAAFSILAMPTKDAFIASSLAVKNLSKEGKPVNLWEKFFIERLRKSYKSEN